MQAVCLLDKTYYAMTLILNYRDSLPASRMFTTLGALSMVNFKINFRNFPSLTYLYRSDPGLPNLPDDAILLARSEIDQQDTYSVVSLGFAPSSGGEFSAHSYIKGLT